MTRSSVLVALRDHAVGGAVDGLLRLEADASPAAMQATLQALGLPADYVQAVDPARASALCGLDLRQAAWFYPGGGWVQPAALARAWLERAAPHVEIRRGAEVQTLHRSAAGWRLCDANGATLGEAATVVLANAGDASRLLGAPAWPVEKIRGQISHLPKGALTLPRIPIAGAGYLLPALDNDATASMFGATAQRGDDDGSVREADHRANLAQLAQLIGHALDVDPAAMQGRTAWRWSAIDRLPLVGAVPDIDAEASRLDQARFVPRMPGLFVFTALGSRGITWSALGARLLASLITGAPAPLEASLVDAVDPARFVSRQARRATRPS